MVNSYLQVDSKIIADISLLKSTIYFGDKEPQNSYLTPNIPDHKHLTLLGLGLIKINDVSANFNNPRPSLILNN